MNGFLLVSGVWKKSWEENVGLWRNQVAIELGVKEGCPLVHSLKIGNDKTVKWHQVAFILLFTSTIQSPN